jgi:hypothetical protein
LSVYAAARIKKAGEDRVQDAFDLVLDKAAGDTSDS